MIILRGAYSACKYQWVSRVSTKEASENRKRWPKFFKDHTLQQRSRCSALLFIAQYTKTIRIFVCFSRLSVSASSYAPLSSACLFNSSSRDVLFRKDFSSPSAFYTIKTVLWICRWLLPESFKKLSTFQWFSSFQTFSVEAVFQGYFSLIFALPPNFKRVQLWQLLLGNFFNSDCTI